MRAVWCAVFPLTIIALAVLVPQATQAAPEPAAFGVVDFYAVTPVEAVSGVIPERTAADDLSEILARAADSQYTMIPRETIEQGEAKLHWNEADVLHFARLQVLARLVHADRLVVGWIEALSVDGSGDEFPRVANDHTGTGFTSLVLQAFDASQGRVVAEVRGTGYAVGMVRPRLIQDVLHNALVPLAGSLLSAPPR